MTMTLWPSGDPCPLASCPPGPFLWRGSPGLDVLGIKTEYGPAGQPAVYVAESGEHFWGGTDDWDDLGALIVTPMTCDRPSNVSPAYTYSWLNVPNPPSSL